MALPSSSSSITPQSIKYDVGALGSYLGCLFVFWLVLGWVPSLLLFLVSLFLACLPSNKIYAVQKKEKKKYDVMPLPSSSSSITPQSIKYDVFLSFRGEDTRQNFTSHLHKALLEKKIETFIDYKLNSGDVISPSLSRAIEESEISIIVFSKGYASSSWCLDELVTIVECMEKYKQIVIPIFYEVDPSDIRYQKRSFAEAFDKHGELFKDSLDKVQRWKDALKKAAGLSGFDSRVIKPESDLIETIVQDVLKRLNAVSSTDYDDEIGINSRFKELESLLENEWKDAHVVGIWGIGGIGKTTLARAISNKMSSKFEGSYFVPDVREASEKCGLNEVRQKLMSDIFGDKNGNIGTFSVVPTFLRKRLARYKLLIVFDDVTDFKQIEFLIGSLDCLNSESRIIITSRDKQVLKNCSVNKFYKVEELSFVDALRLFRWHAFRKNSLMVDYGKLSKQLVNYAGGLPLALQVLGSALFGKEKQVWESTIKKLENDLDKDIHKVLKISYDGLDYNEQEVFLDIAFFIKGWDVNLAKCFLEASDFSAEVGISILKDKSLITVSKDKLTMHDLLQAMGRRIVKEESIKDPGKRSRLWHHEDIYHVFTKNTGTGKIEGISLNMSKIRDIDLQPFALSRMHNLRFLKLYSLSCLEKSNKVHVSQGLESIFIELRYLHWEGCPLKSLQSNIQPEKLVELAMPRSKVENLWSGVQQLANLKRIDLRSSKQLTSLPDLSKAQNLETLNLSYCESLLAIPDCSDLKSLTHLDLSHCLELAMLPQLPHNLQELWLSETPIEELPSSIEVLSRLVYLDLYDCSKLKCLPTSVCKWKSLENLNLIGCSKLDKFPDDIGTLNSLKDLRTTGTVLRELPSSITCLENLETLCFGRIMGQDKIGCILPLLSHNLTGLYLANCDITKVPDNLFGCLSSLKELNLVGNNFESIPSSIINLSNLETLDISNCKRLKVLPELPLIYIDASNCSSLEGLSCFAFRESNILLTDYGSLGVRLHNCLKLDRSLLECIMTDAFWKIQRLATSVIKNYIDKDVETIPESIAKLFYPGNEIPKWFDIQCTGSVIHAELQPDWFNHNFVGFAFSAVVAFEGHPDAEGYILFFKLQCECFLESKDGNDSSVLSGGISLGDVYFNQSTHVFMGLDLALYPSESLYYDNEVVFKFSLWDESNPIEYVKVEKCGVRLMYR